MAIRDAVKRTPWTQQPQYPAKIDWSNPITAGLVFAPQAGGGAYDPVQGQFNTPNGITPTGVGKFGKGFKAASSASLGASWANSKLSTSDGAGTGAFTVFVVSNPVASAAQEVLFCSADGAKECYFLANTNAALAASSGTISFVTNSAGSSGVAVAGAVDGKYHAYAYTRDLSATGTLYVDGVSTSNAVSAAPIWSPTSALLIGGYTSGSNGISGNVPFCFAWNRNLSPAEILSLTANPWQLFAPLQRKIWASNTAAPVNVGATLFSSATSTVALNTAVTPAASQLSQASLTSSVTTAVTAEVVSKAQVTFIASLTVTPLTFSAAISAQVTDTIALTTAVNIAAGVEAKTTLTATLATALQISANLAAQSSSSGSLATAITLAAVFSAQATMTVALTAGSPGFAAMSLSNAAATVTLTTAITLSSKLVSQVSTSVSLANFVFVPPPSPVVAGRVLRVNELMRGVT